MCALLAQAVREGLPETVTLSKDGGESVSPWTPQGRALGAKGARAQRQEDCFKQSLKPVSFRKRWEAAAAGAEGARQCGGGEGRAAATFQVLIIYTFYFILFLRLKQHLLFTYKRNLGRATHGRLA